MECIVIFAGTTLLHNGFNNRQAELESIEKLGTVTTESEVEWGKTAYIEKNYTPIQ